MSKLLMLSLCIAVIIPTTFIEAGQVPTSVRSREAVERVRPSLERALKENGFQWGAPVFMRIFKTQKRLEVWLHDGACFRLFRRFKICSYGWQGLGPKTRQGDGRAPEGFYHVGPSQLNPFSRFHLAFNLGYPNRYDRMRGWTGSALMVHGACVSIGCFAMTHERMEIIYALAQAALQGGQPYFRVHIFPFPMTAQSIAIYNSKSRAHGTDPCRWNDFWKNLKEGYDYFERHLNPPNVRVCKGRYVFGEDE